jgi:hypothetical protein
MLDKSVSSNLQNRLVGPTFEDVNLKRAAQVLSIPKGKEEADFFREIKLLEPGLFYALGRAIAKERTLIKIRDVVTSHPKAFQRRVAAPTPAPDKIKALLPKLADLPKEAEAKTLTEKELRAEIARLKSEAKSLVRAAPVADASQSRATRVMQAALEDVVKIVAKITAFGFDGTKINPKQVEQAVRSAVSEIEKAVVRVARQQQEQFANLQTEASALLKRLKFTMDKELDISVDVVRADPPFVLGSGSMPKSIVHARESAPSRHHNSTKSQAVPSSGLKGGERTILTAIVQFNGVDSEQLGVLTGYKSTSRYEYSRRLAANGLIQIKGNRLEPTREGIAALGDFEEMPTGHELYKWWMGRLKGGEAAILAYLVETKGKGESATFEEVESAANCKATSRYEFTRRLAARLLVVPFSKGSVRASDSLFD